MKNRVVYGVNPVRELLLGRATDVSVVYVTSRKGPLAEIAELAAKKRVTVEERGGQELDGLAGPGARHQGAVAVAGPFAYADLEQALENGTGPLVVLDCVQDPHNLGAIVRSAQVMGARGVVLPKDRSAGVTAAAVKASAGATEHLPIAQVTNLVRALGEIQEAGLWTVGAVVGDAPAPWAIDLVARPVALVVGSEGDGLRRLVRETCDELVQIPMAGKVASLNVSVATGMLLYECARQAASRAAD